MQTVIVILAVLLAIGYLGRRWFGKFRSGSNKNAGCSGCAQCDTSRDDSLR